MKNKDLCDGCRKHSYKNPLPSCKTCSKIEFVPNLLIRIPKTASATLTLTDGITTYHRIVPGIGHNTALQFREFLGEEEYNKRFTFAIVRNPYDRLVSAYHFFLSDR